MTGEIKRPAGAVFRAGRFVFADGGVITEGLDAGKYLVLVFDLEGVAVESLPLDQANRKYAKEFSALRVAVEEYHHTEEEGQ